MFRTSGGPRGNRWQTRRLNSLKRNKGEGDNAGQRDLLSYTKISSRGLAGGGGSLVVAAARRLCPGLFLQRHVRLPVDTRNIAGGPILEYSA